MPIIIELPVQHDIIALADWMEVNTLLDTDGNTSRQDLIGLLSMGADPEEDRIDNSGSEQTAQAVLSELVTRDDAAGNQYPFRIENETLSRKVSLHKYTAYIYCLLISYFSGLSKESVFPSKVGKRSKYFENLCKYSIQNLLNTPHSPATVYVFGFPRDASAFTTKTFTSALDKICKESGEMTPKQTSLVTEAKDAGLDLIAWKRFPDKLPGGILLFGQCAIGKNWDEKLGDLKRFEYFVEIYPHHTQAVFIPHMLDTTTDLGKEHWKMNTKLAGRIFNRCRIAWLSKGWSNSDVKIFCDTVMANAKSQSTVLS